jgi:hypothetical protein
VTCMVVLQNAFFLPATLFAYLIKRSVYKFSSSK